MTKAVEDALTLEDAVLQVQTFVTAKEYIVAAVRPVTVHVRDVKVGTALHVLVEADPPAGVC